MRSVKISIPGAYWDSQLYSGEMILFTDQGSLRRFDWRAAIDQMADTHKEVRTALRVAFVDGELFYNEKVRKILLDPALARPIRGQLDQLADGEWEVDQVGLFAGSETDSPFDFVPTDTDVYYNNLIACGDEGLFTCSRSFLGRRNPGLWAEKHHDARFLQVKASDRNTAVAAAAGSDGLLEFGFERDGADARLGAEKRLANRACSACDWAFQSVVGWSDRSAFLANFKEERQRGRGEKIRVFERVIEFSELFGQQVPNESYSWGAREKFYRLGKDGVTVVERRDDSSRKRKSDESAGEFRVMETVNVEMDSSDVIATGTAPFGSVIELSDRLVVLRSDGGVEVFHGELVHWRIFPRASHYSNQLHLIYDAHMEVVSFVHDYFVDQGDKRFGFARQTDSLSGEEAFAEFF